MKFRLLLLMDYERTSLAFIQGYTEDIEIHKKQPKESSSFVRKSVKLAIDGFV